MQDVGVLLFFIGLLAIAIAVITLLLGIFKKKPETRLKSYKLFGIAIFLLISGFIIFGVYRDPTSTANNRTKQEVKQEEKQVTPKEETHEIKLKPKKEETQEIKLKPKKEEIPEVKQVTKKKSKGFFSSLFGGNGRESTPITDEYLEQYKFLAQRYELQKDELKEVLTQFDKCVDLKRIVVENKVYDKIYISSLPGEVENRRFSFQYAIFPNASGKNILFDIALNDNGSKFKLYDIRKKMTEPPIDIQDLFVTEEDCKALRKSIEKDFGDLKNETLLKGVDLSKLKLEKELFGVSWVMKNDDKDNLISDFYNYTPLVGYGGIYSFEKSYYGGSNKEYYAIGRWFKAKDKTPYDKVMVKIAYDNSTGADFHHPKEGILQINAFMNLIKYKQ